MDLKKWSGDDSSWCLRDRGTNPDPGLLGGGPWAMAVLGIKRALHLTELSQGSPGLSSYMEGTDLLNLKSSL